MHLFFVKEGGNVKQILVRHERCTGCKSCELACSIAHSEAKSLFGAVLGGEHPVHRVDVEATPDRSIILPLQCRQCSDAPCVSACMTGAMIPDEETGLVRHVQEKCVACYMCAMVCPYGSIKEDPWARRVRKCDQCTSLEREPACVEACPTHALTFVELRDYNKAGHRAFLTKFVSEEG